MATMPRRPDGVVCRIRSFPHMPDVQFGGARMRDLQFVAVSGYRPDTPFRIQKHRFAVRRTEIKPDHHSAFFGARPQVPRSSR
jgi:hypothetical protein